MKSLQGLILYHLRGATCSPAIIGMDGTATISRKRRGAERAKKREGEREREGENGERETPEMNRGGERERGRRRRTERKQVGERTKKLDIGVSNSCK